MPTLLIYRYVAMHPKYQEYPLVSIFQVDSRSTWFQDPNETHELMTTNNLGKNTRFSGYISHWPLPTIAGHNSPLKQAKEP